MRVLVVEDEPRLAENIADAMREGPGYAVDTANDGSLALHLLSSTSYDLVLLDLMLPNVSGRAILQRLRNVDEGTPVLVLTAVLGPEKIVELLDDGADDYMTKPFDLGELIARARALIRRGKGVKTSVLRVGGLQLDATRQTVHVHQRPVDLSPTEYRILEYLMHRGRAVVSKRELLEHLYDFTWEHHSNVIEAHISNIRKKLGLDGSGLYLETLRGRGYRLTAARDAE